MDRYKPTSNYYGQMNNYSILPQAAQHPQMVHRIQQYPLRIDAREEP